MQNGNVRDDQWVKWKPEVLFQYGGCPLSQIRSSNNTAVDSAILSKFGFEIDLDIAKRVLHYKMLSYRREAALQDAL